MSGGAMDNTEIRRTAEHLALLALVRAARAEAPLDAEDLADWIVNQDRRIPREAALEAVESLR